MFKHLTIHMTAPICKCEYQDLKWGIDSVKGEWHQKISCNTCGTAVLSPWKEVRISVELDTPYPKGYKPAPPVDFNVDITPSDKDFLKKHNIKEDRQ